MNAGSVILLGGAAAARSVMGPPWPTIVREPLLPFPEPVNYDHVLPFVPPARDLYFTRSQFCGLRVPGAQPAPGSNGENPECIMACLLDGYPEAVQEQFLERYASYGYTHLQRSLGHALHYGKTFAQYNALSKRAHGYGLFLDQWLLGVRETANDPQCLFVPGQDGAFWKPILQPYVKTLLDSGLIDSCCVCWQMDQMQGSAPGNPTISIIQTVADMLPGTVPVYTHWVNDAMAWWKAIAYGPNGDIGEVWSDQYQTIEVKDRFTWWLAMQPYLTGGYYQGSGQMAVTDPGLYQAHMRDTMNPFADGRMGYASRRGFDERFRFVPYEHTGQKQFNGEYSEDEGDRAGYLLACCRADTDGSGVSGYGNGARMPNGAAL